MKLRMYLIFSLVLNIQVTKTSNNHSIMCVLLVGLVTCSSLQHGYFLQLCTTEKKVTTTHIVHTMVYHNKAQ